MNTTLPLEINLDLLGGISFEKGCFIGQEVNARVKYKGLVKKNMSLFILRIKTFHSPILIKLKIKFILKHRILVKSSLCH